MSNNRVIHIYKHSWFFIIEVQQEVERDDALSTIPGFLGGVENALPLRGVRLLTTYTPMPAKKKKKK